MTMLFLIGIAMLATPAALFLMEGGSANHGGDLVMWLMTKTPEQIFLIRGSMVAGTCLATASLMQICWRMAT